jgi:hypothetical protein
MCLERLHIGGVSQALAGVGDLVACRIRVTVLEFDRTGTKPTDSSRLQFRAWEQAKVDSTPIAVTAEVIASPTQCFHLMFKLAAVIFVVFTVGFPATEFIDSVLLLRTRVDRSLLLTAARTRSSGQRKEKEGRDNRRTERRS